MQEKLRVFQVLTQVSADTVVDWVLGDEVSVVLHFN